MMASEALRRRQAGLTTVEVAIVGAVFLLAIFTVIEVGRLMWTWETLNEATRRGARVAAVCPRDHPAIKNVAIFNAPNVGGGSSTLPDLSVANVDVSYLDTNGNPTGNWCSIEFVRVRIINYQHDYFMPGVGLLINAPAFETTLPRESLGKIPGVGFGCFGTPSPIPVCT